jgi:formylglycine-generating enzyme required for sulfatase activity
VPNEAPDCETSVKAFAIDAFEVTVSRFRNFVAAVESGYAPDDGQGSYYGAEDTGWQAAWNTNLKDPAGKIGACVAATWAAVGNDFYPMHSVNWFHAQAFCIWDGGRLPTEAEWEYVASSGTESLFPWGDTLPDSASDKYMLPPCGGTADPSQCKLANVSPVGTYAVNVTLQGDPVYDLAGNVAEWVMDWHDSYVITGGACAAAPPKPQYPVMRSMRGGSFWDANYWGMRAAARAGAPPEMHASGIGFRCAYEPSSRQ